MKITKQELIGMEACENGLNRFIAQTDNTDRPVEVSSLVGGENTYGDLLWLAGKKLPRERIVRFACDCALLNIELIKPYTDKYDEIVEFLRNPTVSGATGLRETTLDARFADARAAYYTGARAAYYTAARAADACFADARAADACFADARAAVYYANTAVYYAADAGSEEKVNQLLKELFA